MPEFKKYADGQMCWVDLSTTDLDKAVPFYTHLFEWTADQVPDPEFGGYTFFLKEGKRVAAAAPVMDPSEPSHWNVSINISDIEKTVQIAEEAGAKVLAPTMSIGNEGRFAAIEDPVGGIFYLWQAQDMIGASIASEQNTWVWDIFTTRKVAAAKDFYSRVFGWLVNKSMGEDLTGDTGYEEFTLGDLRIAGIMPTPDALPPETPSFWSVIFAVDSCTEMTKKAESLGGYVWLANDHSMPGMTFSGINDPTGGAFTIVQMG